MDGVTGAFSAQMLSMGWGLLMPGMGRGIVEALSARQCSPGETGVTGALSAQSSVWERGIADAPFSELTLFPSTLDRTGSGKLSLTVASTTPPFQAVVPT